MRNEGFHEVNLNFARSYFQTSATQVKKALSYILFLYERLIAW